MKRVSVNIEGGGMAVPVSCTWCGNEVEVASSAATVACPKCGTTCGVPEALRRAKRSAPAPKPVPADDEPTTIADDDLLPLSPPAPTHIDDDDDGRPYDMTIPVKRCPHCGKILDDDATACPRCKYDLMAKQIPVQTFEAVRYSFEATWPFAKRLRAFAIYEIGLAVLAVVFSWWQQSPLGGFYSWLFLSTIAAFIAGTYDRIDVSRNSKGRCALSRTWRICFFERSPQRIPLGEYESISTSMHAEREFIDAAIVFWLLCCGILPGVLWWIYVFNRPSYQVALCQGHGAHAMILYRGKSEEHMRKLAKKVSEVCQFPIGLV